jgi:hypothetical protein
MKVWSDSFGVSLYSNIRRLKIAFENDAKLAALVALLRETIAAVHPVAVIYAARKPMRARLATKTAAMNRVTIQPMSAKIWRMICDHNFVSQLFSWG